MAAITCSLFATKSFSCSLKIHGESKFWIHSGQSLTDKDRK